MLATATCPDSPTGAHYYNSPFNIQHGVGTIRCKYCLTEKPAVTCPEAIKDTKLIKWAYRRKKGSHEINLGHYFTEEKKMVEDPNTPFTKNKDNMARYKYYEENREAIIADAEALGFIGMRAKWNMHRSSWRRLRQRWGIKPTRRIPEKRVAASGGKEVKNNGHKDILGENILPSFPAFNENWGDSVKVEWFKIYGVLIGKLAT